ncbi:MAG: hypothetical protein GWO24_00455, partial [Akkermansiaceae bacterium]|nr:hypothetical protein [Akkermansiaceae bacterium]
MPPRPRKIPPLLTAVALVALGLVVLLLVRPGQPAGPLPHPLLADLGQAPRWADLQKYDGVLTRAQFEKALREVYVLNDNWHCTVTDEAVTIESALQPGGQVVRFAREAGARHPPRYWRPAGQLPPAPAGQPLHGLRIAIDPGHLGGEWARMEERWYRIGDASPVAEGDMTLRTARLLQPRL